MTNFDLNQQMAEAEQEYNLHGASDWLKLEDGITKVRVLTPFVIFPQHFSKGGYKGICLGKDNNCPGCKEGSKVSVKWLCWVIERAKDENGKDALRLAKLPHKIAKAVQELQNNPEYAFNEAPMPYDLHISVKNAGEKEVEYGVQAARTNTPVEPEFLEELKKKTSCEEVKKKIKDKQIKKLGGETGNDSPQDDDF